MSENMFQVYYAHFKVKHENCSRPPAFKSQTVGYQSKQILLHHYIIIQKISSIHKFILEIQQTLRFHELKGHDHF